jgi:hypothetical protein
VPKSVRRLALPAKYFWVTFAKEKILERLITIIFVHTSLIILITTTSNKISKQN